jgi:tRNA(Arg) A34 adenosine deaminase TadA
VNTHPTESDFISRSVELAVLAGAYGNWPFGAVFVAADGTVLAEGLNEVASSGDVTAHAELVAIRHATNAGHAERFPGSTMYASGEPCPMCATACVWAGVTRIVFAASTIGFSVFLTEGPHFALGCQEVIDTTDATVDVIGPVHEEETLAAMRGAV